MRFIYSQDQREVHGGGMGENERQRNRRREKKEGRKVHLLCNPDKRPAILGEGTKFHD